MPLTCVVHLRSEVKTTPKSFIVLTISMCYSLIDKCWSDCWLFKKDTINYLVFLTFNFILLVVDHWLTLSTSCCGISDSDLSTITTSGRAQSSTYLYRGNCIFKSFTITRKNRGPSLVPCGTPALMVFQFVLQFNSLLSVLQETRTHQFRSTGGTWSIRSRSFEKSIRQVRIRVLGFSRAESQ